MTTIYATCDREANNIIETFSTREEAENAIESYEEQDKKDDVYEKNFYDIITREEE